MKKTPPKVLLGYVDQGHLLTVKLSRYDVEVMYHLRQAAKLTWDPMDRIWYCKFELDKVINLKQSCHNRGLDIEFSPALRSKIDGTDWASAISELREEVVKLQRMVEDLADRKIPPGHLKAD